MAEDLTAQPDYLVTTGDMINEWLEDHHVSAADLSRRLGVSRKHVSELLSGKATLSAEVAVSLSLVTGVPAKIWQSYEAQYQADKVRLQKLADAKEQMSTIDRFPLKYLRDQGLIRATKRHPLQLVEELCALLRVGSLDLWDKSSPLAGATFRKTSTHLDHSVALSVWMFLGELAADATDLPDFNKGTLEQEAGQIAQLSVLPLAQGAEELVARLRNCGVAFACLPPIPQTGTYGVTRWINRGKTPLVQVSNRGKTDGQFWWTVLHELGHVALHRKKGIYLEQVSNPTEEVEADCFAETACLAGLCPSYLPTKRDKQAVVDLATKVGISPGLALHIVQRRTEDYAWGHALFRKEQL